MKKSLEDYLNHLAGLPYFERRLDIKRRFKPKPNRFLYKYKSINSADEKSKDIIRDLLVRSRLWLSPPIAFNDPFDMSVKVIVKGTGLELRNRYKELLKKNGLRHKERERMVRILMRQPPKEFENTLQTDFAKSIGNSGVFSFAGDPRNILMWSHYSKNHTGVCIQFETARDILTLSNALPVAYTTEYPVVDWVNNFSESINNILLRKHQEWTYEDEHRIVLIGDASTYIDFNPQAIVRIIFGCRASAATHQAIEELLEERHRANLPPIQLLYAKKHDSKYHLSIVKDLIDNDL